MPVSRGFFRTAAVCSFVSVATTLLLTLLPRWFPPAADLAARMEIHGHPAYLVRSWAYLVHPFVVLAAALGVAVRIGVRSSGAAAFGFLCFMLWAFVEAIQQGLTLVAFDRIWRPAFLTGTPEQRETIAVQVATYDVLWDSLFFVLVLGFALGSLLYGSVLVRGAGLQRIVGALYLVIAASSFYTTAVDWGAPPLPGILDDWLYPVVQPIARALIGVWLWQTLPVELVSARQSPG
jgi:hypothetical protein